MNFQFRPPLTPAERGLIAYAFDSDIGGYDDQVLRAHCLRIAERVLWAKKLAQDLARNRARLEALPAACQKCGHSWWDLSGERAKCSKCGAEV